MELCVKHVNHSSKIKLIVSWGEIQFNMCNVG